nr:unnamed protein product [Callosobruchus analis]
MGKGTSGEKGALVSARGFTVPPDIARTFVHKPPSASTIPKRNVNAQTFMSPFDYKEPIKVGPRKSNRKRKRLGQNIIAIDMPEKAEIQMENNATKMHCDSDEDVEIDFQNDDDDYDSEWMEKKNMKP